MCFGRTFSVLQNWWLLLNQNKEIFGGKEKQRRDTSNTHRIKTFVALDFRYTKYNNVKDDVEQRKSGIQQKKNSE